MEKRKDAPLSIKRRKLYYRLNPMENSLVFAFAEMAETVARIRDAIGLAGTWAEFRSLMPRKAYSECIRNTVDDEGKRRPRGSDPFDSGQIYGYGDGHYAEWLQGAIRDRIPREIVENHGRVENSVFNGPFVQLDPERESEIVRDLKAMGYMATKRSDLFFY